MFCENYKSGLSLRTQTELRIVKKKQMKKQQQIARKQDQLKVQQSLTGISKPLPLSFIILAVYHGFLYFFKGFTQHYLLQSTLKPLLTKSH